MIKNFDEVKRQLQELAGIINGYKSEAVQLRIVELILGASPPEEAEVEVGEIPENAGLPKVPRRRKRKQVPRAERVTGGEGERKSTRSSNSRPGSKSTLAKLLGSGFFKQPRTLSDLIQHAETNMALKFKQSDFSGTLARYVRDGKLTRAKNSNNQYEYSEP